MTVIFWTDSVFIKCNCVIIESSHGGKNQKFSLWSFNCSIMHSYEMLFKFMNLICNSVYRKR